MTTIDTSLPGVRQTTGGLVKKGNGTLRRIACSASTAGTITAYDGTDATGTLLLNAFPLTAGQTPQFDLAFTNGLFIVVGGTADYVVVYY
jgi:hypothetical protein